MELALAAVIVVVLMMALNGLLRAVDARRRRAGAQPPSGSPVLLHVRSVPTRLFVEKAWPGGPRSGGINRSPADLVLTDAELVVSTGRGRVMLLSASRPGTAVSTGPQRLVVEGLHPTRDIKIRAELLVDDTDAWVRGIRAVVKDGGAPG